MSVKLDKSWIEKYAEKYDDRAKANKKEYLLEEKIFESIKGMGSTPLFLTKDILLCIAEWKAARVKGHVNKNDEQYIKDITQVSLSTKNERLKIEILTLLNGVQIRMASAILMFCFPEQYTVMDYRAWDSLKAFDKVDGEIDDTFECWQNYNEICREIATQNGVSLRKLDQALWQYKGEKK